MTATDRMNEQHMCTACIVHTLYRDTSGSGSAMWYQIVLSDVLTAYQAMDRFSIDSLLNHCTAARTPLKLMYWTTRALSVGSPPQNTPWVWRRDIFFRLAAHFSVYFSKDVWSIRVGQRAFVVEHTISWLTSVAYVQPCPLVYSVINVATWPSKQSMVYEGRSASFQPSMAIEACVSIWQSSHACRHTDSQHMHSIVGNPWSERMKTIAHRLAINETMCNCWREWRVSFQQSIMTQAFMRAVVQTH